MRQTLGLVLSAAALTFQITVLYPWHLEISKEIQELSRPVPVQVHVRDTE